MARSSADAQGRRAWSLGAYPAIAPHLLPMAAHLVTAADVKRDDRVLDVACGTGNVALTAARRGARVSALDLVPAMIAAARENARISGAEVAWQEGTASSLPFPDGSFDSVLSCVGHIFAADPDAVGREMVRVTRAGGRIGYTSWTPDGVIASLGRTVNLLLPDNPAPPAPPFLWGNPIVATERLGDCVEEMSVQTGLVAIPVLSPAHYWNQAVTESGPIIAALEGIPESRRSEFRDEVVGVIEQYFDESRNVMPLEYVLVTATVGQVRLQDSLARLERPVPTRRSSEP